MFILLPVGVDYRTRRYPVVTFTIMGVCTALWLGELIWRLSTDHLRPSLEDWVFQNLWLVPANCHWWMFVTSQFVHEGFWHLLGNMIYLFLFGSCVEDMIGRWQFILFYLGCGVAAAFAHIIVSPEHFSSEIPLGGASGAISGCIGGFLLLLARRHINFQWWAFFMFRGSSGEFSLPAWLVISFWFLKDFAFMMLVAKYAEGKASVAFAAHVGGTLFGAGLMAIEKARRKLMPGGVESDDNEETPVMAVVAERPKPEVKRRFVVGGRPAPAPAAAPSILLYRNGEQSGPFTLEQVQQMSLAGELPEDALYWREGMREWRPAGELG